MWAVFDVFKKQKMKIRKKIKKNIKIFLPSMKLYFDVKNRNQCKLKKIKISLSYCLTTHISRIIIIFSICSTSSPGGHQVDGLPPALNKNKEQGPAQIHSLGGRKSKFRFKSDFE